MSLYANLEFVYLHNARLKLIPLDIIVERNILHNVIIKDFDQYSILWNKNGTNFVGNKKDISYISSNETIVDIDYISKTYYSTNNDTGTQFSRRPPIQDIFCNETRKYNYTTEICLTNDTKLVGLILGFDNYVVLIQIEEKQLLFYKSSISMLHPLEQRVEIIRYANEREQNVR